MHRRRVGNITIQANMSLEIMCKRKGFDAHKITVNKVYVLNGRYVFAICPVHHELIPLHVTWSAGRKRRSR